MESPWSDWKFLFKHYVLELKTPVQIAKEFHIENPSDIGYWLQIYGFPDLGILKTMDKKDRIELVKKIRQEQEIKKAQMRKEQTNKTKEIREQRKKKLLESGDEIAIMREEINKLKVELQREKLRQGKVKFTEEQEEPIFEDLEEVLYEKDAEDKGGMNLL